MVGSQFIEVHFLPVFQLFLQRFFLLFLVIFSILNFGRNFLPISADLLTELLICLELMFFEFAGIVKMNFLVKLRVPFLFVGASFFQFRIYFLHVFLNLFVLNILLALFFKTGHF